MTVNAITDTKKGRTGTAPTYLHTTHLEIARGPFRDREIAQPSRDWPVLLCQYNFISRTRTRFCSLFANKIIIINDSIYPAVSKASKDR